MVMNLTHAVDVLAEGPLARRAAAAHEGQAGEAADRDAALIAAVAERPFIGRIDLPLGEPGEALSMAFWVRASCTRPSGRRRTCRLVPWPAAA